MQTDAQMPNAVPPDTGARAPAGRPARTRTPSVLPLWQYLLRLAPGFVEEARPAKRAVDRTAYLATMVYEGKHRLWYSKKADWYFEIPGQNTYTTLYHPENYYRFLIKSNAKEYAKSTPSIRAKAPHVARRDSSDAAQVAEAVKGDFQRRHRTEAVRQIEHRRVQLAGNVVAFVDFDPTAGDELEFPIYEASEAKPVPDAYECYECGRQGEMPEPAAAAEAAPGPDRCPNCQSLGVDVTRVPAVRRLVEVDRVKVHTGDWIHRSVPIFEITVNAGARDHFELTDVVWLRWQYIKHKAQAADRWPDVELAGGISESEDERAQAMQRRLELAIGGTEVDEAGTGIYRDAVVVTEDWFQPVAYADYQAAERHEICPGTGLWLEAGEVPAEKYPHGLRFIHQGARPLEIEPKAIRKHFQFSGFDPNPESFYYSGTEDAVSCQFDLNEVNALVKTHAMSASMPTTVIRGQYIKNFGLANHPSKFIEVGASLPETVPLADTIHTVQPSNLGQGVYDLRDKIKEGMQYATGALNNFNGVDQARDRTATQTSILEASALAHAEQVMGGLAASESRLCRLAVALWREHGSVRRAFEISGEAGSAEMKAFSNADLTVDVDFVVEPGTVLPRRPYQERDDFEQFVKQKIDYRAATGETMPPKLERYAANVYGLSSVLVDSKSAEGVARRHLEALRALAASPERALSEIVARKLREAMSAPAPDGLPPAAAAVARASAVAELEQQASDTDGAAALLLEWIRTSPEGAPARVIVAAHKHLEMRDWYEDYLNDERSADDPPLLVALVAARMREHVLASGEKQADFTRAKLAAEAPAMEAQQAAASAAAIADFQQKAALAGAGRGERRGAADAPDARAASAAAEGEARAARPAA